MDLHTALHRHTHSHFDTIQHVNRYSDAFPHAHTDGDTFWDIAADIYSYCCVTTHSNAFPGLQPKR